LHPNHDAIVREQALAEQQQWWISKYASKQDVTVMAEALSSGTFD